MATAEANFVKSILEDHFGPVAKRVGTSLLNRKDQTLPKIIKDVGLSKGKVQDSLLSLIQHNIVLFNKEENKPVIYNISVKDVLLRVRYPRYLQIVNQELGEKEEIMFQIVLHNGRTSEEKIIELACNHFNEDEDEVGPCFQRLVQLRFIIPIKPLIVPDKEDSESDLDAIEPKRKKSEIRFPGAMKNDESGITELWRVNYPIFHYHIRNQLVEERVHELLDDTAALVMKQIFNVTVGLEAEEDNPACSFYKLDEQMKTSHNRISKGELNTYLEIICSETNNMIEKCDQSQGGQYRLSLQNVKQDLQLRILESTIQEKYGSTASRIFRCVVKYSNVEQQQVSHYCVLPLQETCELLGKLYKDGFLYAQEIPKLADYSKTVALYSYNLKRTCVAVVAMLHKIASNLIGRKLFEIEKQEKLLENLERREAGVSHTLKFIPDSVDKEKISETEAKSLEKFQNSLKLLHASLSKIDETLFIMRDL